MVLGANKLNSMNALKACINKQLYDKEYLQAKVTLLPTTYTDVTQEEIDELLGLLNPIENPEGI
ncbi:hypothetical protein HZI73_22310 [Vallitalea pronyensis]|uniref:Uncharacterized protein n=1 Tax=Vallitalea pronyensis TaxID=1348613 RepID=A0A8J8SIF1_9FIRM|nr:hypothetical protein [Vallitalea pronyensis]QUI24865.1 hypothetical protein HZI73_22310 [Vallitalea pronyensis]